MTRKRWGILTTAMLLLSFALIISAVVLIDPFEIYHQATAFIPPIDNGTQNYSNAGVAKSYEYDSVIIGSSMTENFTPSQLDALLGGRFVKLPINAGSPFNHQQMMDMAFRTHAVKRVLYGIDIESMTYFYKTPKCEMPDYLYDDDLFNDTSYWFNSSVLLRYIPACLRTLGQRDPNLRDTMYNWGALYAYGENAVLRNISFSSEPVPQTPAEQPAQLSQQTRLNVEHNILPFVKDHPETAFTFFFPPYSLVRWYEFYQAGAMESYLAQKEALTASLLEYPNVKVFDFQARTDWILDLNNYIDTWHYGPWINDSIVECIAAEIDRVTDRVQIQENNAVIRRYMDQLVAAGTWPDTFDTMP